MEAAKINRYLVLNIMIRHETLSLSTLAKNEAFGADPDILHLGYLVQELLDSGDLKMLPGTEPPAYTITDKGIEEGKRLAKIWEESKK